MGNIDKSKYSIWEQPDNLQNIQCLTICMSWADASDTGLTSEALSVENLIPSVDKFS